MNFFLIFFLMLLFGYTVGVAKLSLSTKLTIKSAESALTKKVS